MTTAEIPTTPLRSPIYLKTDEVAARLRICPRTVQKLADRGDIPAVQLGKLYRFDPEKIAGLFANAS